MNSKTLKPEVQVKFNTKIKILPDGGVRLTCFSKPVFIDEGYELIRKEELPEYHTVCYHEMCFDEILWGRLLKYNTSDPRNDNLRVSRGKVFEIAYANCFDWRYMITLTLSADRIDRYNAKKIVEPFKKWLNNMTVRKGLMYLIVPELHEDGAIHFHGLINGALDLTQSDTWKIPIREKPVRTAKALKFGYKLDTPDCRPVYNIDNYNFGWSTAVVIDNNYEAICNYVTKYMCKDFKKIFGKTYFAGGGVKRQLLTNVMDLNFRNVPAEPISLPDNLGMVKYLKTDTQHLEQLLKVCDFD